MFESEIALWQQLPQANNNEYPGPLFPRFRNYPPEIRDVERRRRC